MISLKTLKHAVLKKKVLIDSNIIIYLTEEIQPYFPLSQELFSMIENGETEAIISILSVVEIMQGPLKAGKKAMAKEVQNYLVNFPNSKCIDINLDVLQHIGSDESVNWKTLRAIDSMIIASGLHCDVDLFISNDRHFQKALSSEVLLTFE